MTTSKPALLQLLPFSLPNSHERLSRHFRVIELWKDNDPEATLLANKNDITALVTSAMTPTTATLIDKLPALKAICSQGVGYDAIDVKYAQQKNIQVSNTPDVLNDCVADLAWGLMLATARKMGQAERYLRSDQWENGVPFPLGTKVSGKKLGIVGLGRIGLAIARRAAGFDMAVRYHNRNARNDVTWDYEPSLLELAKWADFLVIATVGGSSSHHLIDQNTLEALGPQGIIINISRGTVIDEAAMVEALKNGKLGGAGLDVFESEPQVPQDLKKLDNAVLLPHVASATNETRSAMANLVLDNVDAYATTGQVITPIPAL